MIDEVIYMNFFYTEDETTAGSTVSSLETGAYLTIGVNILFIFVYITTL